MRKKIHTFVQGFGRTAADAMVDDAKAENNEDEGDDARRRSKRSKKSGAPFSAWTERGNQYPRSVSRNTEQEESRATQHANPSRNSNELAITATDENLVLF